MDLGIAGKRALVSGASRGIGKAIAESLAKEGVRVILCSRDEEKCKKIAEDIAEQHEVEAHGLQCDQLKMWLVFLKPLLVGLIF